MSTKAQFQAVNSQALADNISQFQTAFTAREKTKTILSNNSTQENCKYREKQTLPQFSRLREKIFMKEILQHLPSMSQWLPLINMADQLRFSDELN